MIVQSPRSNGARIGLRVLWGGLNIFDVKAVEEPLKGASDEFAAIIMNAANRPGVASNQLWTNLSLMCQEVLLSILINSTKFDAVSMQVNTLNSTLWLLIFTVHGPIKSIATSSQGAIYISLSGNSPYPLPDNLCLWQCSHLNLSIVYWRLEW